MKIRYGLLLTATAALVSLSACGSGDDNGSKVASVTGSGGQSSAPADDGSIYDKQVAFAKCMREHGIDLPDPDRNSGGMAAGTVGKGVDLDKMNKADDACRHLLPNGGAAPPPSPADLDKLRKQAQCLRAHGLDVKDPDEKTPALQLPPGGLNDPKTTSAMSACGLSGSGAPAVVQER